MSTAYAETGDYTQAIEWIKKALKTDDENKDVHQKMLKSYVEGKPYREEGKK